MASCLKNRLWERKPNLGKIFPSRFIKNKYHYLIGEKVKKLTPFLFLKFIFYHLNLLTFFSNKPKDLPLAS